MAYCDEHPESEIQHSVAPKTGTFGRDLGAEVKLDCHKGYQGKGDMLVTCVKSSPTAGKWNTASVCEGMEVNWKCLAL